MSPSNEPNISSERTEQERERAREDRERRRLAKAAAVSPGLIEPPIPPPVESAAPPVESAAPSVEPIPPVVAQTPPLPSSSAPSRTQPRWSYEAFPLSPPATALPAARRRSPRLPVLIVLVIALALLACAAVLVFKPINHPAPVSPPPKIVKLVIPEGFTRAQIAARSGAEGLRGDYTVASAHSTDLDPTHYGAPAGTHNLEGFLFPATYELYAGESVSRLVSDQLTAFKENFGGYEVHRAHVLGITPYQLLTVASMVEREAQVPGDRAKIAAVIYNRLHDGMPLGIDATIYYAVEQQQHIATYTGELTESQLHIDSPYNTRLHTGLTPTPISNPGLASIEAAAHPAHVPYLYYVAGADGCGEQVFSTTAAQFEIDAAAYHTSVARNGGKPPVCKRK